MNKSKIIGVVIGVVVFIFMIIGLTYAWFTWQSSNTNVTGTSNCFNIDYGISQEIGSSSTSYQMKLGESYTDGEYASVTLSIDSKCAGVTATGKLYLNTNTAGTSTEILSGALKYTVIEKNETASAEVATGTITSTDKLLLLDNIPISASTSVSYEVWVWIDGNIADNTYYKASYSGYISAEATQTD